MTSMPRLLLLAAPALLAVLPAAAQEATPTHVQGQPLRQPVYKCGAARYTQVPCAGGQELGAPRVSRTYDRNTPPPQDRARQMARAQLPPETREQCSTLEHQIRAEESRLRTKGSAPTEAEEGDLAIQRVHYRELHC